MDGLTANTLMTLAVLLGVPTLLLGATYLFRRVESKERLAAIEKGAYTPASPAELARRTRRTAIVLITGGLGVIAAFVVEAVVERSLNPLSSIGLGIVPVAIGIGLAIDLRLRRRDASNRPTASPVNDSDRPARPRDGEQTDA